MAVLSEPALHHVILHDCVIIMESLGWQNIAIIYPHAFSVSAPLMAMDDFISLK